MCYWFSPQLVLFSFLEQDTEPDLCRANTMEILIDKRCNVLFFLLFAFGFLQFIIGHWIANQLSPVAATMKTSAPGSAAWQPAVPKQCCQLHVTQFVQKEQSIQPRRTEWSFYTVTQKSGEHKPITIL